MKVSRQDSTSDSTTARQATRIEKRSVSWRCTTAGSPSITIGRHSGSAAWSNSTSIGCRLPRGGTSTVPMPVRKRESSVRASSGVPQRSRVPWRISTWP